MWKNQCISNILNIYMSRQSKICGRAFSWGSYSTTHRLYFMLFLLQHTAIGSCCVFISFYQQTAEGFIEVVSIINQDS